MKLMTPKPSVSEVRDSVMDHIKQSGIAPGGRIPTERELQEIVGVSRSRIRDALAALESHGIVKRLVGSGTYLESATTSQATRGMLTDHNLWPSEISLSTLSPSQLIEARIVFEVSLSSIVVRNATNYDLKQLEQVLDASEETASEDEFERLDTEFHHLIAVAAHNQILTQFSQVIREGRLAMDWRRLKRQSSTPIRLNGYQSDHRRILQAFQERSAEAAAMAMRDHLLSIHHAMLMV